jgi:GMP synthase (glutamine-hydrolysing)
MTVVTGTSGLATAPVATAHDTVLVLDFGSQYSQLIARRVREAKVYCELLPGTVSAEEVRRRKPRGLVFSGGPASVYEPGAPRPDPAIYELGLPILGICYGMQLLAQDLGGAVEPAPRREYGLASLVVDEAGGLFERLPAELPVWMSHGDVITRLPPGFRAVAHSLNSPCAAMAGPAGRLGIQFHPEVVHTPLGREVLRNFLYRVCGCSGTWEPSSFIDMAISDVRSQVGDGRVLCALSGGVDSAVAATLVHRAIGDQLVCVFVDNGLLRRAEADRVIDVMSRQRHIDLVHVDASDRFLTALAGVVDPEEKRRRIGRTFIEVFEQEARRLGQVDFLAQGTLYPDVIESTARDTHGARTIKTHHNVGGLPEDLRFALVEPLRYLFKDDARAPRGPGVASALPRSGAGHPLHRRGHPRAPRDAACRRLDRHRRDQAQRPLPRGVAVVRHPHPDLLGRGDGRRTHLRQRGRHPRRHQRRRHDRRLGEGSLRRPRRHLAAHRQRGAGREPRRLRHQQQAPVDDRMGVRGRRA